jgi:hypothetical protein
MKNSVNMSETEALLKEQGGPVYSGSLNPVAEHQNDTSRSIANSEYLIRKSKEDFNQPGIPVFRAIFVVMNGAMGAGILNFPQAFAKAGGIDNGMAIQMVRALSYKLLYLAYVRNLNSCCFLASFPLLSSSRWGQPPPLIAHLKLISSYLFFQGVVLNQISGMGSHPDKKYFDTLST